MLLLQLAQSGRGGHAPLRPDPRAQWAPGHAVHAAGGALPERAADPDPGGRAARHGSHDADAKLGTVGTRRAREKRARARPARALSAVNASRAPGPRAGATALAPGSSARSDGDR